MCGLDALPEPLGLEPDAITRTIMRLLESRLPNAPGCLERFERMHGIRHRRYRGHIRPGR